LSVIRPEIRELALSGIAEIALGALDDPEVIPLWFGESDMTTPPFIREAAKDALESGKTFYSYTRGHTALRHALHRYHQRVYGLNLDPDRITSPGSTMLTVTIATQMMVRAGDEVVLIGPYWPNIRIVVEVSGGRPVPVRLLQGPDGWQLDLDAVAAAITPRTRAVYVNSPSNPTGWIMSDDEAKGLLNLCRRHGLGLISDEVYHRNVYDGADPAPSLLHHAEPNEPVFVLNGFSKAWAMTGWRIGWMITPAGMAAQMAVLAEVYNTGSTAFAQYGGVAALDHGEAFLRSFVDRCRRNRDLVENILAQHPRVRMSPSRGAFYAFPRIEGMTDSLAFCRRVLAEEKVGLAPGYTFGPGNEGNFRLCFARRSDEVEDACRRIVRVIDRLD
jgi:aspartate/methionine/tyrosine aminotransferase